MQTKWLEVGKIMGAHGVKGDLRVMPFNEESDLFVQGGELYFAVKGTHKAYTITRATKNTKGFILHFTGVETRTDAEALFGQTLFFPREKLATPEEGSYYFADLVGFAAEEIKENGETRKLGSIVGIEAYPAQDCLVINGGKNEILVPVLPGVLATVDLDKKTVALRLPDGLVECYEG